MPTETKYHDGTRIDLLRNLPKGGICAELGVFRGDFSAEILDHASPQHLYLVDIWEGIMRSGDRDGEDIIALDMTLQMALVAARFPDPRVEVVKAFSWAWLSARADQSLDWIYIDTSHTLEATQNELSAAWRVMKPGGYICGHDYDGGWFPGVVQAVNEFCNQHQLALNLWRGDRLWSYQIRV